MKGRPPKPTELKLIQGTFRKDRETFGIQAEGEARPTDDLTAEASAIWNQIVPELASNGLAKERDGAALAAMCQWLARYRMWGSVLDSGAIDPKLARMTALAWEQFNGIASRFGMTPSDRAKMRIGEKQKESKVMQRAR